MSTLLLDTDNWDLVIDANGNIAVTTEPYSLAQDACSAIKTQLGELYYDTKIGVPYNNILARPPNIPLLKEYLEQAAMTVPGIVSATCFISSIVNRSVSGQVQVTDASGITTAATF